MNTVGSFACVCNQGYTGDGVTCSVPDVDECATGAHTCSGYATCKNTVGAFTCNCNSGYSGNGYQCTEDNPDECATGQHNCDVNAECLDKNWGFKCRCNSGYQGDGVTCTANNYNTGSTGSAASTTDPCAANPCSAYATCYGGGAYAGFSCSCRDGYTGDGMGAMGCYDEDECFTGSHNCAGAQTCINMIGSFVCSGSTGYSSGTSSNSGSYSSGSSSSSDPYATGSSSSSDPYSSGSSNSGSYSSGNTSSGSYTSGATDSGTLLLTCFMLI